MSTKTRKQTFVSAFLRVDELRPGDFIKPNHEPRPIQITEIVFNDEPYEDSPARVVALIRFRKGEELLRDTDECVIASLRPNDSRIAEDNPIRIEAA